MATVIFVDDCRFKTQSEGGFNNTWVGFCGLILDDDCLPKLDNQFERLKDSFGFPDKIPKNTVRSLEAYREAKYNPTKNHWMHSHLVRSERNKFFESSIKIIENLSGKFIFSMYDCTSANCSELIAKHRALVNLYERISNIVKEKDSSIGIVVCDIEGNRAEEQKLVTRATGIARFGTWYQRDIKTHVYPVLLTGDSNAHAGLQIADISIGAISNMFKEERAYAPLVWNMVLKCVYKKEDKIRGWGLKIQSKNTKISSQIYEKLLTI